MNWASDCAVLIPCLNEASAISTLIPAVREKIPSVFVVDDGSRDGTPARARAAGAEVLRHETTRGKGAALQTGWSRVLELGFEWCLTMDGDGQHSPDDLLVFLRCAEETAAQLIVGNRMGNCGPMPPLRRWVNRWMSRRISKMAGQELPDSQCGFRLIHLESLSRLDIVSSHFEIESEILMAFARAGLKIQFVPIRSVYKTDKSNIDPMLDTLRWLRWWSRSRRRPACAQPDPCIPAGR